MPDNLQNSPGSSPSSSADTLTDRVRVRVAEAALALGKRTRRSPRSKLSPDAKLGAPRQSGETRSLRRVFKELAVTHREYRARTGRRASPALRDAARAFKEAPTLPSLVVVAAFLDEDGLLAW